MSQLRSEIATSELRRFLTENLRGPVERLVANMPPEQVQQLIERLDERHSVPADGRDTPI